MSRSDYAERYATDPEFRERKKAISRRSASRRWAERYATDPEFRERKKALSRKSHHVHRDKILAKRRADYAANREAIKVKEAIRRADPAAKQRARERSAEWRRLHPGRLAENHFRRKYGITVEVVQEMLAKQHGRCAICHSKEAGGRHGVFVVDHDHVTGALRGLLCNLCNITIGQFNDDVQRLRAAAAYLERHAARTKRVAVA